MSKYEESPVVSAVMVAAWVVLAVMLMCIMYHTVPAVGDQPAAEGRGGLVRVSDVCK